MGYSRRNVILGSIAALMTGIAAPLGIATVTLADGDRKGRRGRSGNRQRSSSGSERSSSSRSHTGGERSSSRTRSAGRGDDDSDDDDDDRRRRRNRNSGECRIGRFPDWQSPQCRNRFQASM